MCPGWRTVGKWGSSPGLLERGAAPAPVRWGRQGAVTAAVTAAVTSSSPASCSPAYPQQGEAAQEAPKSDKVGRTWRGGGVAGAAAQGLGFTC